MGRTTDEWAALLNGTTEGPWGHCIPWGGWNPVYGATPGDEVAKVKRPADHRLVSAAPEAVAEVIRLRRALEEQRERFRSHAKADGYLAKVGTVPLVPFYGDQARLLDRILNGDTDH